MVRIDVAQLQASENVETAPVRDLTDALAKIQLDSTTQPADYLVETETPHGGE
jgi:hypothetical protein